jgi:plastocyanin
MKILFMFLAVAGLATFGVSCSSSDDSGNGGGGGGDEKTLSLSADKKEIKEGESVTFTVKVGDKAESGAEFYIGSDKISNPHTFDTEGEYKVVAKKEGFKDSNVVTVKVTKEGDVTPDPKTLVLKASPATVSVGETVNFTVQADGQFIADATIKLNGETVSNPWTATEVGTFKFKASKEGYEDSSEVTVTVNEAAALPENYVKVGDDFGEINNTRYSVNAVNIEGSWVIYEYQDVDDAGNPDGEPYAVFTVDLGKVEGQYYEYRSILQVVVEQTDPEFYLFPGDNGVQTYFVSAIAADFTGGGDQPVIEEIPFEGLERMMFSRAQAATTLDYFISSSAAEVKFLGDFDTSAGMSVDPVNLDGSPVQNNVVKQNERLVKRSGERMIVKRKK